MSSSEPKIFSYTIYRLPTKEELIDVDNHHLNSDEIIKGFHYTIIGRGMKSKDNMKMIKKSIEMLSNLFPDNNEYKAALSHINGLTESKLIRIINEEISAIKKDKDKEIFDYHSITQDAWREKVHQAKDFQKIGFDLENDDSTGEKKTFYVKKNLRRDQPIKYEINAELFEAGGDWENPVLYFRLEFSHDYGIVRSDDEKKKLKPEYVWDLEKKEAGGLYKSYVIIPPNEAGNKLQKGSKGDKLEWYAYDNNEIPKEKEKELRITDTDKRKAWDWLAKLLEKVINERHEILDDDRKKVTESVDKSKYSETKDSLMKSKSIDAEMKKEILKYLGGGSTYHEGGHLHGLIMPKELKDKSPKIEGVSMGADKDGFFVYTHRARSKSHPTPDKITVTEINFIESTG